jgi:phosphoribosyl-AMP cyclohydrolase
VKDQSLVSQLTFDKDGLVPAIIQDADTNAVLMLGFMNDESLRLTRETGRVHFWSRSRAKLWRKGETSGHESIVHDIYVNCEQNTLLIAVNQIGAICHTGYPTCFYRRLEDDDSLTVVRDRWFDPATVYGTNTAESDNLLTATRLWYGAYEYLRSHDLSAQSSTSHRLQPGQPPLDDRIADELRELAGVLDGTHRHQSLAADIVLEASQVLYWIALGAVRNHITWDQLRPDAALRTAEPDLSTDSVAKLLKRDADRWQSTPTGDRAATLHATIALVSQACHSAGITPNAVITADLSDLRSKPYLTPYFDLGELSQGRL